MAKGIRAILKTAIVRLTYVHESYSWGAIWKVYADIRIPQKFVSEGDSDGTIGFLSFKGQASSALDTRGTFVEPRSKIHVSRAGAVYGLSAETEMGILHESADGRFGTNYPDDISAFRRVVASVIEDRNLSYKYPDCDLSQVLEAIEILGASIRKVEVTYNGQTYTRNEWSDKCYREESAAKSEIA